MLNLETVATSSEREKRTNERPLVIHHANCFDGVAAAWVVWKFWRGNADLHPAHYNEPPPDVKDRIVYVVDFSYPRADMDEMYKDARQLLVLDHHKTAEAALKGAPYAVFDMERSGCGITWDWFHSPETRPWLINTIEDRDLWRFKFSNTRVLMAYIATVPMTVEAYDKLTGVDALFYEKGEAILQYITKFGEGLAEHAFMREIGGYAFWVINTSYQNSSDHVDLLLERKKFDKGAYFFMASNGKWQFGLRSRGDFDVSAIAQLYGGGGHKNASGFLTDKLPWEK